MAQTCTLLRSSGFEFGGNLMQVFTVFLASFIGGSFFTQFQQWIDDPSSAVTIIGMSAPATSIFFLTYIVLQVRSPASVLSKVHSLPFSSHSRLSVLLDQHLLQVLILMYANGLHMHECR